MFRKAILQYTYYTSVPTIHYTFPNTQYSGIRSSYPKGYELIDSNFSHNVLHETGIPFPGYPNIVEKHFFHVKLPYGKKRHINSARHKYNTYNSSHNNYTSYYDSNSSDNIKKSYKNRSVKEVKSVNSETIPNTSSSYGSYLPRSTARTSRYNPSFISSNYNSNVMPKPIYIKVKQTEPVFERTLLSRSK